MFYREGLLAPRPTPKLEDHPLSTVHDCLFNLFAATLHKGGRSSIRNLRTRHAVVTGTHYTVRYTCYIINLKFRISLEKDRSLIQLLILSIVGGVLSYVVPRLGSLRKVDQKFLICAAVERRRRPYGRIV